VRKVHGEGRFRLIYPPKKMPKDLGRVDFNFAQLLGCDVVILNISPDRTDGRDLYNPGVMVEYGMVFASDRTVGPTRWPTPTHKVFCHDEFQRANLSPPLGLESVEAYARTPAGHESIVRSITDLLNDRVKFRLDETGIMTPQALPYGVPFQGRWSVVNVSGLVTGQ
jgi:hypothetical protein